MSRSRDNEVVEVTLQIHHETEKAYLVSESGDKNEAVWLPKSMCERGEKAAPAIYTFDMPEWLALEKGFLFL